MKHLFSKAAIIMSLACTPAFMHAQAPSVDYGRTTLNLSTFASSFQGATITDLKGNPLLNNTITFEATGGVLDLTTGAGTIEHKGGLRVDAGGGTIIRIQNFILDTTTPAAPVITADFILNDHFGAHLPLFSIQPPAGTTLPLQLTAGTLQQNNFRLTITPSTAAAFNSFFGDQVVQPGVTVGYMNNYFVFSPMN